MTRSIPQETLAAANARSRALKALVAAPEILVMPGAYDVLSALLFAEMGFKAIQGTSGGIAAVLGYADGEIVGRERTLEITGQMAEAVSLPVNADGEKGYGNAEETADFVEALIDRGIAGMNLEDSAHPGPQGRRSLVPLEQHLDKVCAAVSKRRSLESEFFLNARVDVFLLPQEMPGEALHDAVRRGNAYAEAGADCIFYINVTDRGLIERLVTEVQAPVSILWREGAPTVPELEQLGVARVSYGSAFARAAITATKRLALEISEKGTATLLRDALSTEEMRRLLRSR